MFTIELPRNLQEEFERTAHLLYDTDSINRALVEAIELWVARQREILIETEATANDRVYERLQAELEREQWGKWIVIAHGELQGSGDTLEEVLSLAPDARDRIVMQVGMERPKLIELGWEASFQ